MAGATIRFAASAVADLEALASWYESQGAPGVGEKTVAGIVARIETLADYPAMGRVVPEFDQTFLRELLHPPFRIVYRCEPAFVRIVRIWRSERVLALPDDEET